MPDKNKFKAYAKEEAAKKKNAKTLAYRQGKGRNTAQAGASKRRVEERSYDSKRTTGSKINVVREKKASAIKKKGVNMGSNFSGAYGGKKKM